MTLNGVLVNRTRLGQSTSLIDAADPRVGSNVTGPRLAVNPEFYCRSRSSRVDKMAIAESYRPRLQGNLAMIPELSPLTASVPGIKPAKPRIHFGLHIPDSPVAMDGVSGSGGLGLAR